MLKTIPSPYSIKTWLSLVFFLIIMAIVYYLVADRRTPYTGDAYVQSLVIQVAPQIDGEVTAIHVANNGTVQKGDSIFEIDPRPFQYEVDRLKALLVERVYEIKQIESTLDAQKAVVLERQADVDFAQQTFDRIKDLTQDSFATQQRLDQVTGTLTSNKAVLRESEAHVAGLEKQLEAMIDGEHATVKQVKAQLALAEWQLSKTTIRAPAGGIVTNVQLSIGSYVQTGAPVLSLVDTSNWWIVANIRENALSVIEPGQQAQISLLTYPGKRFRGTVESIGWGVQQGQGVPSGALPDVENPLNWITLPQRFQVRILVDPSQQIDARVGASAQVVIFAAGDGPMAGLARLLMTIDSYINYIY